MIYFSYICMLGVSTGTCRTQTAEGQISIIDKGQQTDKFVAQVSTLQFLGVGL